MWQGHITNYCIQRDLAASVTSPQQLLKEGKQLRRISEDHDGKLVQCCGDFVFGDLLPASHAFITLTELTKSESLMLHNVHKKHPCHDCFCCLWQCRCCRSTLILCSGVYIAIPYKDQATVMYNVMPSEVYHIVAKMCYF